MIHLLCMLERYALFFGEKNRNPFIQIELGARIEADVIPMVKHGFINGLADMVHHKRKDIFPDCNQESDWFKSERIFYKIFFGLGIKMLVIKYLLLAAYSDCIKEGYVLPGIDDAMQDLGVYDEKIIATLNSLSSAQCDLLFHRACVVALDATTVELFLRREIAQLYLENEDEIMKDFSISC